MKIAFDGQLFLKANKTGIAWNAHNLILELAKYPENECVIQCFTMRCTEQDLKSLDVYEKQGCRIESCGWFHSTVYKLLWNIVPVPYRTFFHEKPDITQFFNFIIPPGVLGKKLTIIHDMAYKSCPQTVHKKTRGWLELCMKKTCRRADHILTVSEFSKQEISRYLNVPKEKITVIPNAVDHTVYHPAYPKQSIQNVLEKYGIENQYFLYLGTIEPRKNLEKLIEAYAGLCRETEHAPQLVLAGGRGWLCDSIYEKAEQTGLGKKILFTGYVSQEESPLLMCGALAFVFPSLYEGFGMPPLEAMACATPVITSNTTSLPEVVGDAGITVNPDSADEIRLAMRRLLENEAYRGELGARGYRRAGMYTWKKSAELLMEVYRKL